MITGRVIMKISKGEWVDLQVFQPFLQRKTIFFTGKKLFKMESTLKEKNFLLAKKFFSSELILTVFFRPQDRAFVPLERPQIT